MRRTLWTNLSIYYFVSRPVIAFSPRSLAYNHNHNHNHININHNDMLIRVRSNVGTWKLQLSSNDQDTTATVQDVLQSSQFQAYKVVQPLSLDPSGNQPLSSNQSLQQQGLQHGSMVYCRLEEQQREEGSSSASAASKKEENHPPPQPETTSQTAAAAAHAAPKSKSNNTSSQKKNKEQVVVDLLESSDDDEEEEAEPKKKSIPKQKSSNNVIVVQDSSDEDENLSVNLLASSSSSDEDASPKKRSSQKRTAPSKSKPSTTPTKKSKSTPATTTTSREPSSENSSTFTKDFQIASYNVWFGPPDATARQVFPRERMTAIAQVLQEECVASNNNDYPLLCIGFQELTSSLKEHINPLLQQMGYKLCTQPLDDFYGVGLAIPHDMDVVETKFVPFTDSTQRRGLLYVQTPTMLFGTTHLESFVDPKQYDGVQQREKQIVQAAEFCQERLEKYPNLQVAVLAGDFNWDDERKRGVGPNVPLLSLPVLKSNWQDAGQPFDYTYDGKENPMLANNLRRRLDRCIYLPQKKNQYQVTLQKVGMKAIPNLTWNKKNPYNGTSRQVPVAPSDHFGLVVTFKNKS